MNGYGWMNGWLMDCWMNGWMDRLDGWVDV